MISSSSTCKRMTAVQVEELLAQHLIEGGRLGQRARIAVHDEALRPIIAVEALGDHVVDEIIGNEFAAVHVGFGAATGGGVLADGLAQDVAGANVFQTACAG